LDRTNSFKLSEKNYNNYHNLSDYNVHFPNKTILMIQTMNVKHVEFTHFDGSITGQTFLPVLIFNDDERSSELVER
jgi:hypothetical protein